MKTTNLQTRIVIRYLQWRLRWIFQPTNEDPHMHDFSPTLEWQCFRDVITIARAGDLSRNKLLEISQHAFWFSGCAAEWAKSAPEPDGPDIIITATGEDTLAQLESCIPADDAIQAIDWRTVVKVILPLLLQLLDDLFSEWSDKDE